MRRNMLKTAAILGALAAMSEIYVADFVPTEKPPKQPNEEAQTKAEKKRARKAAQRLKVSASNGENTNG